MRRVKIFEVGFVLLIMASLSFAALPVLMGDQGNDVIDKATGNLLNNGDLTVLIYNDSTSSTPIYNETFVNAINNGEWNVMLGEDKPLYLDYGKVYYKDYKINGEDMSFVYNDGSTHDRRSFMSPMGYIEGNYTQEYFNRVNDYNITYLKNNDVLYIPSGQLYFHTSDEPAYLIYNDTTGFFTLSHSLNLKGIELNINGEATIRGGPNSYDALTLIPSSTYPYPYLSLAGKDGVTVFLEETTHQYFKVAGSELTPRQLFEVDLNGSEFNVPIVAPLNTTDIHDKGNFYIGSDGYLYFDGDNASKKMNWNDLKKWLQFNDKFHVPYLIVGNDSNNFFVANSTGAYFNGSNLQTDNFSSLRVGNSTDVFFLVNSTDIKMNKLVSSGINSTEIKADEVNSVNFNGSTASFILLNASNITADNIQANKINSNEINSSSIETSGLTASTVNSDSLNSNSINSGVAVFDNVNVNDNLVVNESNGIGFGSYLHSLLFDSFDNAFKFSDLLNAPSLSIGDVSSPSLFVNSSEIQLNKFISSGLNSTNLFLTGFLDLKTNNPIYFDGASMSKSLLYSSFDNAFEFNDLLNAPSLIIGSLANPSLVSNDSSISLNRFVVSGVNSSIIYANDSFVTDSNKPIIFDGWNGAKKLVWDSFYNVFKFNDKVHAPSMEAGDFNGNDVELSDHGVVLNGTARVWKTIYRTGYDLTGNGGNYNGLNCSAARGVVVADKWVAKQFSKGSLAASDDAIVTNFKIPDDAQAGQNYNITIEYSADGTSGGDFHVGLGYMLVGNGSALNSSESYVVFNLPAPANANQLAVKQISLDGANLAPGKDATIILYRDDGNSQDTDGDNLDVIGIGLTYLSNKLGAAS